MVSVHIRERRQFYRVSGIVRAFLAICFVFLPATYGDSIRPARTATLSAAAKPAAQATGKFEQEWSELIASAQREGAVVIASGGAPSRQYRPVVDVFQKKFGIKVELSTGSATDTVNRVLAERKAGRYTADVALISLRENNQRLVPSGSLVPIAPLLIHPEVVDTSGWYQGRHWYSDPESKHVFISHVSQENQYEVWHNTGKIKKRK